MKFHRKSSTISIKFFNELFASTLAFLDFALYFLQLE